MRWALPLRMIGTALSLLRAAAWRTATAIVGVDVVAALANAAVLVAGGRLIGLLADAQPWSDAVPWLVVAAVALVVSMATNLLHAELTMLAAERVEARAVDQVLRAAGAVPYASFDQPRFHDRLVRAREAASEDAWSLVRGAMTMSRSGLELIAIAVVLIAVAPVLVVVAALAFLPLLVVSRLTSRLTYDFRWAQTEPDRRRGHLADLLTERRPAKEVRLFALADELAARHEVLWNERLELFASVVRRRLLRSLPAFLLSSTVLAVSLGYVVWATTQGDLTIDQAGVGVLALRQAGNAVGRIGHGVEDLHRSSLFVADFEEFVREATALAPAEPADAGRPEVEEICVNGVSFSWPGAEQPVLDDITATFRRGTVTALVGANGSGKTTLVMLLAGLYNPDRGLITWDGVDLTTLPLERRRRSISALFQDHVPFHLTVRENITLDPDDDVGRALGQADAAGFVAGLRDGVDSRLGRSYDEGVELSQGEWQRLALARALHRRAPVLLLDEPASALDTLAEARLVDELRASAGDRAVVMVSHRFSSVRRADQILVFDQGRIIEQGTHDELLARRGAYAALFEAQAS